MPIEDILTGVVTGYPSFLLLVVLVVGLVLACARPFWAFIFAVVLFGSLNIWSAIMTRTTFLGPYFNLYDALLVVALFAMVIDRLKNPFIIPSPVVWILLILSIGSIQIMILYHINYGVLRQIRWAISFPLAFLIGANFINKQRAQPYLYGIIIGSIIGSLSSFIEFRQIYALSSISEEEGLRYALALKGLSPYLLVAAIIHPFFKGRQLVKRLSWSLVLIIFGGCVFLAQWRSFYVSIVLALLFLPLLTNKLEDYKRAIPIGVTLVFVVLLFLIITFPKINPSSYLERLSPQMRHYDPYKSDPTRMNAIIIDLKEWSEGNWFIGRGLDYFMFLKKYAKLQKNFGQVAWGHVAYSTYLSNLGLIGFYIYAIYLPLLIFRASKRLYRANLDWAFTCLGILGLATVVMRAVMDLTGGYTSYMGAQTYNEGFLYGAIWYLAYKENVAGEPVKEIKSISNMATYKYDGLKI